MEHAALPGALELEAIDALLVRPPRRNFAFGIGAALRGGDQRVVGRRDAADDRRHRDDGYTGTA